MVTLEFSIADLLRCRFAISAVREVVEAAYAIANPPARAPHNSWLRQQQPTLQRLAEKHDLRPLFTILTSGGPIPDFLTPLPTGSRGEIDCELARIHATPEDRVQAEVDHCLQTRGLIEKDVERCLRAHGAARRLAESLAAIWTELVAPSWRLIRDCLERDILYRSRALGRRVGRGLRRHGTVRDAQGTPTARSPEHDWDALTRWGRPLARPFGLHLGACRHRLRCGWRARDTLLPGAGGRSNVVR